MKAVKNLIEAREVVKNNVAALPQAWSLRMRRDFLQNQSYSPAFPGSSPWLLAEAYAEALAEFDRQHPEIREAILAEEAKKRAEDHEEVKRLGWI